LLENGIISEFVVTGLRLQKLLTDYDSPDEVYIRANPYHSDCSPPTFNLLLYNGRKYFWTQIDFDGKLVGNIIEVCLQSFDPVRTWLGSPNGNWELKDTLDFVFGPHIPTWAPKYPLMTLKEATGMDMETFTKTFKDPNNRKCIETPLHLWDGSDIGIH
jgi:hypothetical protein